MQLVKELFSSDVGIMSAVVIGVTLVMGAYFTRFFLAHMREDEAKARAAKG